MEKFNGSNQWRGDEEPEERDPAVWAEGWPALDQGGSRKIPLALVEDGPGVLGEHLSLAPAYDVEDRFGEYDVYRDVVDWLLKQASLKQREYLAFKYGMVADGMEFDRDLLPTKERDNIVEIADLLGVSVSMVRNHGRDIEKKARAFMRRAKEGTLE